MVSTRIGFYLWFYALRLDGDLDLDLDFDLDLDLDLDDRAGERATDRAGEGEGEGERATDREGERLCLRLAANAASSEARATSLSAYNFARCASTCFASAAPMAPCPSRTKPLRPARFSPSTNARYDGLRLISAYARASATFWTVGGRRGLVRRGRPGPRLAPAPAPAPDPAPAPALAPPSMRQCSPPFNGGLDWDLDWDLDLDRDGESGREREGERLRFVVFDRCSRDAPPCIEPCWELIESCTQATISSIVRSRLKMIISDSC